MTARMPACALCKRESRLARSQRRRRDRRRRWLRVKRRDDCFGLLCILTFLRESIMSDPGHNLGNSPQPISDEGGLRAPPGLTALGKAWWWFHFLILVKLARLRFVV